MAAATEIALPTRSYRVWIKAAPEQVRQALADPRWLADEPGARLTYELEQLEGGVTSVSVSSWRSARAAA